MEFARPRNLGEADTLGFSYGYNDRQHTFLYVPVKFGFGEPLGNPERVTPEKNTMQEAAKQGYWRL